MRIRQRHSCYWFLLATDFARGAARRKVEHGPIEVLVENGEMVKTYRLDYHDGERFPHLERDASKPDLLEKIIHPLTQ